MRLRNASVMKAASILLLTGMLVGSVALRGDAGVRGIGLSKAVRWSQPTPLKSALTSTAGGRIAFAAGREIYLINSDGSGLTQLTHSDPNVYNFQPALSPDGTRVAFGRAQSEQAGISLIDVDGSGLRNLTTNTATYDSEPAWSADGSKIAFVRGYDTTSEGVANFTECGSDIYVVNVDTVDSIVTNLTHGLGGTDPSWSPDGTRIAFATNRDENYEIYTLTIQGGQLERLTQTEAQEAEPAWSPDGKRIAYASNYRPARQDCGFLHTGRGNSPTPVNGPDIYVMSSDGTNQNRLTETENNFEPTWSPDGTALAFVGVRDDIAQIFVMDVYHKTEYAITSDSTYKLCPSWSRADPRLPNDAK